ncbi:11686_t:CDS:2, partial [Acaulospora colombiana]
RARGVQKILVFDRIEVRRCFEQSGQPKIELRRALRIRLKLRSSGSINRGPVSMVLGGQSGVRTRVGDRLGSSNYSYSYSQSDSEDGAGGDDSESPMEEDTPAKNGLPMRIITSVEETPPKKRKIISSECWEDRKKFSKPWFKKPVEPRPFPKNGKNIKDTNIQARYGRRDVWTVAAGLRELIQNCYDGTVDGPLGWVAVKPDPDNPDKDIYDIELFNFTRSEVNSFQCLGLGETTKRNNAAMIGGHGDGLKMGLNALLRDQVEVAFFAWGS